MLHTSNCSLAEALLRASKAKQARRQAGRQASLCAKLSLSERIKPATMVNSPSCFLSLAVTLCVLLEEGLGFPSPESTLAAGNGKHLRTKRCSCINWMDKECIYFCHLDIIWINTPSHAMPYGLGNLQKRQTRSLGRCECFHAKDSDCATFCHGKSWDHKNPPLPASTQMLLDLLRSFNSKSTS